jgi:hypothetical protein
MPSSSLPTGGGGGRQGGGGGRGANEMFHRGHSPASTATSTGGRQTARRPGKGGRGIISCVVFFPLGKLRSTYCFYELVRVGLHQN